MFHDIKLQTKFNRDGFVLVDFMPQANIEELKKFFLESNHDLEYGFYTSIWSYNEKHRKAVNSFITNQTLKFANKFLKHYEPVFANYMVKKAQNQSSLGYHQDWTFSLEGQAPAVNIWFPLTQITDNNGTLKVIPGTHNLNIPIRARNHPSPLEKLDKKILDKHAIALKPNLGQAIIFHEKLVHGSENNHSDKLRLAASMVMSSKYSSLVHILRRNDKLLLKKVSPHFFTDYGLFSDLSAVNGFKPIDDNNVKGIERHFKFNRWKYTINKLLSPN